MLKTYSYIYLIEFSVEVIPDISFLKVFLPIFVRSGGFDMSRENILFFFEIAISILIQFNNLNALLMNGIGHFPDKHVPPNIVLLPDLAFISNCISLGLSFELSFVLKRNCKHFFRVFHQL